MTVDKKLLATARDSVLPFKDTARQKAIERLEELMNAYCDACKLSNGPDPDRCAHWEQNALLARRALEKFIVGNGGTIEKCKGK